MKYHSALKAEFGDAVVIGATALEQLEETLAGVGKGGISNAAARAIDEIWEGVRAEAVLDLIHL